MIMNQLLQSYCRLQGNIRLQKTNLRISQMHHVRAKCKNGKVTTEKGDANGVQRALSHFLSSLCDMIVLVRTHIPASSTERKTTSIAFVHLHSAVCETLSDNH